MDFINNIFKNASSQLLKMDGKILSTTFHLACYIISSVDKTHTLKFKEIYKYIFKIKRLFLSSKTASRSVYYAEVFK